jgi:hypothetical protein
LPSGENADSASRTSVTTASLRPSAAKRLAISSSDRMPSSTSRLIGSSAVPSVLDRTKYRGASLD